MISSYGDKGDNDIAGLGALGLPDKPPVAVQDDGVVMEHANFERELLAESAVRRILMVGLRFGSNRGGAGRDRPSLVRHRPSLSSRNRATGEIP